MGRVIEIIDTKQHQKKVEEVKEWLDAENRLRHELDETTSYQLMSIAHKSDWFLDPIIGFFPVIGDLLTSILTLPALHIAMFKLKNIKLSIAIIAVIATDVLIGFVPMIGDVLDIIHLSNRKAYRMVTGTVKGDPFELKRVNKWATWGVVGVIIMGLIVWALYEIISNFIKFLINLF